MKNLTKERSVISGFYIDENIRSLTEPEMKIKVENIEEGEFIRLSGKISKYNNFYYVKDAKILLRNKSLLPIFKIRKRNIEKVKRLIRGEIGNIVCALFLGERDLPQFIEKRFQKCGAAHLLAVSGLHTGIVYLVIFLFVRILPIKRKITPLLSTLLLTPYIFLSGFKISVLRAYLMLFIYSINELFERKRLPLNIVGLSGMIIMFLNPLVITSVSFQLSFLSVIGIIVSLKISERFLGRIKSPIFKNLLILFLIITFSAQLFTLPFVVYYFNYLPLYSVFANIILIPLVTLLISSMLFLLSFPFLDKLLSYGIWFLGFIMNKFMMIIENLPLSTITIKGGYWIFLIYIPLFFILILSLKKKPSSPSPQVSS